MIDSFDSLESDNRIIVASSDSDRLDSSEININMKLFIVSLGVDWDWDRDSGIDGGWDKDWDKVLVIVFCIFVFALKRFQVVVLYLFFW